MSSRMVGLACGGAGATFAWAKASLSSTVASFSSLTGSLTKLGGPSAPSLGYPAEPLLSLWEAWPKSAGAELEDAASGLPLSWR